MNETIPTSEKVMDVMYEVYNYVMIPFWAWMLLLPTWKLTVVMIRSRVVPAVLGLLYVIYMITSQFVKVGTPYCVGCGEPGIGTMNGLMASFTNKFTLQGAWIHYLAFDYLAAIGIVEDARAVGVPHAFVVLCSVLTLAFGPGGFLLYWIGRVVTTRVLPETQTKREEEEPRWFISKDLKKECLILLQLWFGSKEFWIGAVNCCNCLKLAPVEGDEDEDEDADETEEIVPEAPGEEEEEEGEDRSSEDDAAEEAAADGTEEGSDGGEVALNELGGEEDES